MAFCKGCGAVIEWHKTSDGKNIPVNPDPTPRGNLVFDERARMVYMRPGSKPKMWASHFSTCPEAESFRKQASCDRSDCERTDRHFHCFRCGSTDHLADECEVS